MPSAREIGLLTRIGYRLAIFLLIYLSAVTMVPLIDFVVNAPSLPKVYMLDDAQLNQYQQLSQIAEDRTLKLLDALVLKGFLPVFTKVDPIIKTARGLN